MRPKKPQMTGEGDLFRARLDQIINMKHELVQLAGKIDWEWLDGEIAALFSDKGRPGIATRFVIGLLLLKHVFALSDEQVCDRWVYDPYFQYFTGAEFFQHAFPHERSDLTHWRGRLGAKLELLLAETLRIAHAAGALRTQDLARVTVDTTVQPKAISFPTDAKLLHAAIKGLNRLAKKHGVRLRQSYLRLAKRAALMAGRYAHAKQFKRHQRQLRFLRARLGRLIRDIGRNIVDQPQLEAVFQWPLARASQIRSQQQRQRGWKLYSFHAPEVECIGKGKAAAPYEFGVKASITTTNGRAPGGVFVLYAKALPGNPYDGHTLGAVIAATEQLTGRAVERVYVDKGYRGHKTEGPCRVFISGQKRGVFGSIKRELRRRSAIEAAIGHMKTDGHLGRCYLKGAAGDAANVILSAVGHNLRLLLTWLRLLLRLLWIALGHSRFIPMALNSAF
ncbi:MAG TPA: IS5 family transposase [Bradyrhizobium sp.]|jgi:IS5 family transposase|uniref:IS5 family transposase n=1 Tax=Bradyrhizobium sp. TaxID=376 RepID=UPI002C9A64D5|nr:IS5 family transposase [Bradyrhizobium sp.]HLZ05671.1 IS5 family transposase [Bradyrhizobium sp.]